MSTTVQITHKFICKQPITQIYCIIPQLNHITQIDIYPFSQCTVTEGYCMHLGEIINNFDSYYNVHL